MTEENNTLRYWLYWQSTVDKSCGTVAYYTNKKEAKAAATQCRKDDKESGVTDKKYVVYDLYEGGVV